jgi:hypothetical protein
MINPAPFNESGDLVMLLGSCHCGAVTIELPSMPETATSCNCSLCRRVAGLWAYYAFGTVRITGHPDNTQDYVQGDRTLRTFRCATCGCVTHWEPLAPEPGARHGVNLRNFDPKILESVQVRRFDGADTWKFLGDDG